ncbi:MAG: helix-turn-helix domain-containing protein [Microbacterium sp.]
MKNIQVREDVTSWVTPADAAAALGITPKSVGRLADKGVIRAIRPTGGHRRYAADDVEAVLARAADWSK